MDKKSNRGIFVTGLSANMYNKGKKFRVEMM